jgi:pyruvate formate lyase activating enzyme
MPEVLKTLYGKNLLDYVAMDIKHRLDSYDGIGGVRVNTSSIAASIDLIKNGTVDYEFRTTIVPQFHGADDVKAIALQLAGAKRFALQEFVPDHAINGALTNEHSIFSPRNSETMAETVAFCRTHIAEVITRPAT